MTKANHTSTRIRDTKGRGLAGRRVSNAKKRPAPKAGRRHITAQPHDIRFTQWVWNSWNRLEFHHQQRILSICLLILSLLLFSALTVFQTAPVLNWISSFFLIFFGWSAYLLAFGLVVFALAHLIESICQQQFIRFSLVIGLVAIWLLLLIESALITGPVDSVGVLGMLLLTIPFLDWSRGVDHVIVLGLLLVTCIVTFRLRFGHVVLAANYLKHLFPNLTPYTNKSEDEMEGQISAPTQSSPSFRQRPQYSRYSVVTPSNGEFGQGPALSRRNQESLQDHDWENDDDPLNEIAIHQQHIDLAPHEALVAALECEQRAARSTQQKMSPPKSAQKEQNAPSQGRVIVKLPIEMEPLTPKPHLRTLHWTLPSTSLLDSPDMHVPEVDDPTELARIIQNTLRSLHVEAEVLASDVSIGPTIIRFGIRPTGRPEMRKNDTTGRQEVVKDAAGNIVYATRTRVKRILDVQNDLALALAVSAIRMEAPVPGRPYVGVEIPNKNSRLVTLREVLESKEHQAAQTKSLLSIGLGRDVAGLVRVGDLAKMPHLLIAGATGSGKSVCLNTIIASLLMQSTPDDVRLLMVDPKMVELTMYNGVPHLLSPVVTEVDKVVSLLGNAIDEMERRYRLFSRLGVRNLDGYRKLRREKDHSLEVLPAIVIIIDELADLMMAAADEVEGMICRLAQLARATGIHLIVATQRPSVDVITGLIKANIPTRISFMVSSAVDSRTILDMGGAERLLGRGDMLYLEASAGRPERIQGAFLSDDEAQALADYWRRQSAI